MRSQLNRLAHLISAPSQRAAAAGADRVLVPARASTSTSPRLAAPGDETGCTLSHTGAAGQQLPEQLLRGERSPFEEDCVLLRGLCLTPTSYKQLQHGALGEPPYPQEVGQGPAA